MEKLVLFQAGFLFLLLLQHKGMEVEGSRARFVGAEGVKKLFVFGDSYVDAGNTEMGSIQAWKSPYGLTFPGQPNGRWSDGRVMSDVFAILLGILTPVAYQWRGNEPSRKISGMNFAYGGTGVFNTLAPFPNMTQQIDFFEDMIKQGQYSSSDVEGSITVVSLAGNDYVYYLATNGSLGGIMAFSDSVVKQLGLNLKRLQKIGLEKIVVASMPPVGCLPGSTSNISYTECFDPYNQLAQFHNILLEEAVKNLNGHGEKNIAILDLYTSFMSILQKHKGGSDKALKPCCEGREGGYKCGDVDTKGNKQYTVCEKAESAFFWDDAHPSHAGWSLVSPYMKATIEQIL